MKIIKIAVMMVFVLTLIAPNATAQRGRRDANESASTPAADTSNMSIEELQERVSELEEENEDLRSENERLKVRIDQLSGTTTQASEDSDSSTTVPELVVGETFTSNEWSITVTGYEISPSITSSYETNSARGVYTLVYLTVVNEGPAPAAFPYDDLRLSDSDGRTYTVDSDSLFNLTYVLYEVGSQYDEMQPGLPYVTAVAFDIPATSTGLVFTSGNQVFVFRLD